MPVGTVSRYTNENGAVQHAQGNPADSPVPLGKEGTRVQSANLSADAYRSLGLLTNPFSEPDDGSFDSLGTKLTTFNAANSLLSAIDASASDPDRRPVIVEKPAEIPASYHVSALADALGRMADGELPGVLQLYVPIDMMRMGRVRAVLSVMAERVAYTRPDLTIVAWASSALAEPDTALPEWTALAALPEALALAETVHADPEGFSATVFGAPVQAREGADDFEIMMRISTARQEKLESDPGEPETVAAAEEAGDDPLSDAFLMPLGEMHDKELEEKVGPAPEDLVAEYLYAHAAAHLSPVLSRGLKAYRAQGIASMAEELKVTKAPTKTLSALAAFATYRFRAVAVILDRFDVFEVASEQLRADIATTLFQLRWKLKEWMVFVLLLPPGLAPQIEESFGSARRVDWSFSELEMIESSEAAYDAGIAARWLSACSLNGMAPEWAAGALQGVPDGLPAIQGYGALAVAIDAAAASGRSPMEGDVAAAVVDVLAQAN